MGAHAEGGFGVTFVDMTKDADFYNNTYIKLPVRAAPRQCLAGRASAPTAPSVSAPPASSSVHKTLDAAKR